MPSDFSLLGSDLKNYFNNISNWSGGTPNTHQFTKTQKFIPFFIPSSQSNSSAPVPTTEQSATNTAQVTTETPEQQTQALVNLPPPKQPATNIAQDTSQNVLSDNSKSKTLLEGILSNRDSDKNNFPTVPNYALADYFPNAETRQSQDWRNFLTGIKSQPISNLSPRAVNSFDTITDAKVDYANTEDKINYYEQALKNPELQGEQRADTQKALDASKTHLSDLANGMAMLRSAYPDVDFNAYGFGKDNTVQQSLQARENLNARLFDSLDLANNAAWQRLDEVRQQAEEKGYPPAVVEGIVESEKQRLGRSLRAQSRDLFANYGVNSDGTYNSLGLRLLGNMAETDPHAAQLFAQATVSPNQKYQLDQSLLQNLLTQDAQTNRTIMSLLTQKDMADDKNALTRDIANQNDKTRNRQLDIEENHYNEQYELGNARLKFDQLKAYAEALRKQQEDFAKTPEGKLQDAIKTAKLLGKDVNSVEGQAFIEEFMGVKIPNLKERIQANNQIGNDLSDFSKMLMNGDFASLREAVAAEKEKLNSEDFTQNLNAAERQPIENYLDQYDKFINGKISLRDFINLSYVLNYYSSHPNSRVSEKDLMQELNGDADPKWFTEMTPERRQAFLNLENQLKDNPKLLEKLGNAVFELVTAGANTNPTDEKGGHVNPIPSFKQ